MSIPESFQIFFILKRSKTVLNGERLETLGASEPSNALERKVETLQRIKSKTHKLTYDLTEASKLSLKRILFN